MRLSPRFFVDIKLLIILLKTKYLHKIFIETSREGQGCCRSRKASEKLLKFIDSVPEFRRTNKGNIKYKLRDIVFLLIIGRICGCEGRPKILAYGKAYLGKMKSMGMFRNGLPSESTLCRIENGIDNDKLAKLQSDIVIGFQIKADGKRIKVIAIDGKCMRGTTLENGTNPDILGAYSTDDRLMLATELCGEKSNEITAAPRLLDKIDVKDKVVTSDAMLCQKEILDKVTANGGHFLVEVKANQKALKWGVEDSMMSAVPTDVYIEDATLRHGRIESRACRKYKGEDLYVDEKKWGKKLSFIKVETSTIHKRSKEQTSESRIYMTDMNLSAKMLNYIAREHWRIESFHWSLDTNLKQDSIRRKLVKSARNLDTFQRLALSILSIWRNCRRKKSDKTQGDAKLIDRARNEFSFLMDLLSLK